jgi:hypothetical protein
MPLSGLRPTIPPSGRARWRLARPSCTGTSERFRTPVLDTEAMKRWRTRWPATALLVCSVAGCAFVTRETGPGSCADPSTRPATRVAPTAVPAAPLRTSNVVIEVSSTLAARVRLTVTFDEASALDIQVPGTDARCMSQPVYRYGYRLPPGPVTVKAASGNGPAGRATLHVQEHKRWLVIQVQDGFPVSVREWNEKPAWG